MKTMCLVGVILLSVNIALAQPTDRAAKSNARTSCADSSALNQIVERWKTGYNEGDAAKVAALYAENAYYLTQHFVTGIVHGRAAIQAYVQNGVSAHYRVDSIQVVTMHCVGDFAYTVTRYESTNAGQKAFGVNLVVLQRLEGRWMIVAHEAAVPDPATAIQHLSAPDSE